MQTAAFQDTDVQPKILNQELSVQTLPRLQKKLKVGATSNEQYLEMSPVTIDIQRKNDLVGKAS